MMSAETTPTEVILIDGTCIFCNRLVLAILRWDRERRFHFAHIQSEFAAAILARHGMQPDVDAIYLVTKLNTPNEQVLVDAAAGRGIWPRLFPPAAVIRYVPLPLLNLGYRGFARVRYRVFGQYASCKVPSPEDRARFVA